MSDRPKQFTVGWICALPVEYAAALAALDEEYTRDWRPEIQEQDDNKYTFGLLCGHDVVVTCLPKGLLGTTSIAVTASRMQSTFPNLRVILLVGIAGGAPSKKNDIRLDDVVVGVPADGHPGVLQYDFGKLHQGRDFQTTGSLAPPPKLLLNIVSELDARLKLEDGRIARRTTEILEKKKLRPEVRRPAQDTDRLYLAEAMFLKLCRAARLLMGRITKRLWSVPIL